MRPDLARQPLHLGVHHFAFFRSFLEALPLDQAADRYLETGPDIKSAKRTLFWIRAELIAAAKRYAHETGVTQASMSRLLRIAPEKLSVDQRVTLSELPDLEEFRAAKDPGGFYSEAELIAEFEQHYATPDNQAALRVSARNARLRKRTNRALHVLEKWLATIPKPTDPIAIWLHPAIVKRLSSGETGILTIEDLVAFINIKGHLWHRRIKGFGPLKAKRVIAWLQINKVLPLNEFALVPFKSVSARLPSLRPKETGIVPIEHLRLSVDLDGSIGTNRYPLGAPKIDAKNDQEAIESWIQVKASNDHTQRSYRLQAERLLLWATMEKGRALSSLTPEDCAEYKQFLGALDAKAEWSWLQPRSAFVGGSRATPRWHPDWKPFTGPLTMSSQRQAIVILKGLFAYLQRNRYVLDNPFDEIRNPKKTGKPLNIHHALNAFQWQAVMDELKAIPAGEAYRRMRFILWSLYSTGLRLSELISLRTSSLIRDPDRSWDIRVMGKGSKEREIPLREDVMGYLLDYMECREQTRNPMDWPATLPLISSLSEQHAQKVRDLPLSESALAQLIKRHFDAAAERLDDMIDASQLRMASTHWLRHTFVTEIVARGAGIDVAQELAGHADSATTSLYTHADKKRKRMAVELLANES